MARLDDILGEPGERAPRGRAAGGVVGLPDGEWVARGVYRIESAVRIGEAHGAFPFADPDVADELVGLGASPNGSVFLDLETTGLSGGAGTYAFLCGLGASDGEFFRVTQFFLEGPAFERNWLDAICGAIPDGAGLVTYNGRNFDIPMLRTRHVLARSEPTWSGAPHLDLLYIARGLYRGRLQSCSLGSVESRVLGVRRSGADIPGWQIPQLYAEYLRTRDAGPLLGVFYHNRMDILSLAALHSHANRVLRGESRLGFDLVRAGDIFDGRGLCSRADDLWRAAAGREESAPEALARLAFREKRAKNFAEAARFFRAALEAFSARRAKPGSRAAEPALPLVLCVELAKIAEHRERDHVAALAVTERALGWISANRAAIGDSYGDAVKSLEHRRARLISKCEEARNT